MPSGASRPGTSVFTLPPSSLRIDPAPGMPGASVQKICVAVVTSERGALLIVVSSCGLPPLRPIDLSAPCAPGRPALVHTTPCSPIETAKGSGWPPASAVGPVYGGAFLDAEDHGPH